MRLLGESIGVPIKVYGPDTHTNEIIPIALRVRAARKSGVGSAQSIPPSAAQAGIPSLGSSRAQVVGGGPSADNTQVVSSIHPDGEPDHDDNIRVVPFSDGKSAVARPCFKPFDSQTRSPAYYGL